MSNLPPNWSWVKISDVGEVVAGGTPSTKIPEYFDGKISWITPADLTGYRRKYISQGRKSISEEGLKNSSARIIPKGSILFSSRAPIGYVAIASNELCTNQGFKNLIPNKKVDSEFVYYYLKSAKQLAEKNASGTTFKEISSTNFKQLLLPLPPLAEQKIIVEKIEELFSGLDSGVASLKKAKEQIRLYRQSVLSAVFSGRLTREARSEKQAYLNGVQGAAKAAEPRAEYSNQLPDGWKWVKNKDLLKYVTSGSRDWKKYYSNSGARFIRTQDINTNRLIFENTAYVKLPEKVEGKRSLVEEGDLLMTITGANVGKVAVIDFQIKETYVSQSVALLKYLDKKITKYLWYYFQAPDFGKSFIEKLVYGMGRPVLSLENMREVDVLICPYEDQIAIIAEIEKRFSEADNLDKAIDESLAKSETLRQSILKQAFSGKLIMNN